MKRCRQSPIRRIDNIDIVDNLDIIDFSPAPRSLRRAGFSILEMASVLAILALIIGAATGAFLGWQHGAAIRGAEDQVYAALGHTRQYAIANRVPAGLALGVTTNAVPGYPSRVFLVAFTNDSEASSPYDLDYGHAMQVTEISYLPLRTTVSVTNAWQTVSEKEGPFVIRFLADGRAQTDLDSEPVTVVVGVTRGRETEATTTRAIRLDPLTGIPHSLEDAP